MERRLLATACIALVVALLGSAETQAELQVNASLEVAAIETDAAAGFPDGSLSKLRYGKADNRMQLLGGYLQLQSDYRSTLNTKLAVNVNPQSDDPIGIIDAFVQFRPLPWAGLRMRGKVGAFRPPLSFEHGADGWETLYTTNASAINSWVGEELGMLGLELSLKRDLASTGGRRYWSLGGAVFYGNDTAGTLLSWRGWSINNWQTNWGGTIDLPPLRFINNNDGQSQRVEPFLEMDDRPGFYGFVELGEARRWRVRMLTYDNQADPTVIEDGQYGWRANFLSVSAQWQLARRTGLIAQWMDGVSAMGELRPTGRRAVDIGYQSSFIMLTQSFAAHRLSLRYETFDVTDRDDYMNDDNNESGSGWTLSYQYRLNDHWRIGAEWLAVASDRPNRNQFGQAAQQDEHMGMLVIRWTY
ncbi:MAG: hypothetical protein AAF648_09055 [Pseudomonadota bacterium]